MFQVKRPRRPIKRTPSIMELSLEADAAESGQPFEGNPRQRRPYIAAVGVDGATATSYNSVCSSMSPLQHKKPSDQPYAMSMAPPRNPRGRSADYVMQPAQFMRACGFCKRRIGAGRDTFMYRGEAAFCSLECRQRQMNLDEMKEKRFPAASIRGDPVQSAPMSEASGDGETMAA